MSAALNWLLALAALSTALVALLAPRPRSVSLAVAANTLCVAALCARLSAPLVAGALALLGVGMLGSASAERDEPVPASGRKGHPVSALLLGVGGLLLAVAVGSVFYVGSAPGLVALGARPAPLAGLAAAPLAAVLFDDYGLGVLAVALLALAVAVGQRLRREGE